MSPRPRGPGRLWVQLEGRATISKTGAKLTNTGPAATITLEIPATVFNAAAVAELMRQPIGTLQVTITPTQRRLPE
jgi:hypothetical protein